MRYEEFIKITVSDYLKNGTIPTDRFPDFDLYIDQMTSFFDRELSAFSGSERDSIISKAMINNYSKKGLVPRPEKKKYSKEHMLMLTTVFYLKNLFPVDGIEMVMKPIIDNYYSVLSEKIDFEKIYEVVMNEQQERNETFSAEMEEEIRKIKKGLARNEYYDDQIIEMLTLIIDLSLKAEAQKFIAESLINEYFIKPVFEKANKIKKPKKDDVMPAPTDGKEAARSRKSIKQELSFSPEGTVKKSARANGSASAEDGSYGPDDEYDEYTID